MCPDIHVLDIIKTITGCLALIALTFTAKQLKLNRSTLLFNSIKGIHEENTKVRKLVEKAVLQREKLISILELNTSESSHIYYIYSSEDYDALREVGYHYEYIGLLVKKGVISFDVLFDLIQFPDKFWIDSAMFIHLMRNGYAIDFWDNFEYLSKRYEKKRKGSKKHRSLFI